MAELSGGDRYWANHGGSGSSQPVGWGLPKYQELFGSIMDQGIDLGDMNNVPALSNEYYANIQGQGLEGIAGAEQQAQNQLAQLMASRGMTGSGAEFQGMGDIMRSGIGERSKLNQNMLLNRQQNDLSNFYQTQDLRNQMAQLGQSASSAWQSAKNAGAAAGAARSNADWGRKMDFANLMMAQDDQNWRHNQQGNQAEQSAYYTPYQAALSSY